MREEMTTTNWPNPELLGAPPMSRAMRTREEQIAHLSYTIFNEKPGDIDNCISLAREYILEAERRAEQRVRVEAVSG